MKSSYYYLIFQVIQEFHALNSHVVTGMIMSDSRACTDKSMTVRRGCSKTPKC
jgi:hypothetical protein